MIPIFQQSFVTSFVDDIRPRRVKKLGTERKTWKGGLNNLIRETMYQNVNLDKKCYKTYAGW